MSFGSNFFSTQLSLKVHPDKCKHPKAEEAFKRVNEAKRILIDPRYVWH